MAGHAGLVQPPALCGRRVGHAVGRFVSCTAALCRHVRRDRFLCNGLVADVATSAGCRTGCRSVPDARRAVALPAPTIHLWRLAAAGYVLRPDGGVDTALETAGTRIRHVTLGWRRTRCAADDWLRPQ